MAGATCMIACLFDASSRYGMLARLPEPAQALVVRVVLRKMFLERKSANKWRRRAVL